jgi:hypothetical protein
MPTAPESPFVAEISAEHIAALAKLYDRFAHAFDPFSTQADEAERDFMHEVAELYDSLPAQVRPSFVDFQKGVVVRCRRYLHATDKPSGV